MATSAELYAQARERGGWIDLSNRARWRVTGADRVRFMNGQISNDARKLAPAKALRACVMTAKGKMSGDIFISGETDFLCLDAESALRESLAARLERYLISDDVAIEDVTDETSLLHLLAGAAKLLPPDLPDVTQTTTMRYGRPGVDLLMPRAAGEDVRRKLSELFVPLPEDIAETLRIEAGMPRWGAELDEETIPIEAGLAETAIDYHKGCYLGQEIISRLKSVGHVNRELRGFVSDTRLEAGSGLFAPGAEKAAGRLTSVTWSFGLERFAALGYLKRGLEATVLEARGAGGNSHSVEVRTLPLIP